MRPDGFEACCKKRWRTTTAPERTAEAPRCATSGHDLHRRVGGLALSGRHHRSSRHRLRRPVTTEHIRTELFKEAFDQSSSSSSSSGQRNRFHSTPAVNTQPGLRRACPDQERSFSRSGAPADDGMSICWPGRSSPPSSACRSTPGHGRPAPDYATAVLTTSTAGTTPDGGTARSTISVRGEPSHYLLLGRL